MSDEGVVRRHDACIVREPERTPAANEAANGGVRDGERGAATDGAGDEAGGEAPDEDEIDRQPRGRAGDLHGADGVRAGRRDGDGSDAENPGHAGASVPQEARKKDDSRELSAWAFGYVRCAAALARGVSPVSPRAVSAHPCFERGAFVRRGA